MWPYRYRLPWSSSRDLLVGLRLRGAARRLGQRADQGPVRQINLERVVAETLGFAQHDVGCTCERRVTGRLAAQRGLGLSIAPRLVGNSTKRKTRFPDVAAIEFEADRDGNQRECIGQPIPD